MSWFDPHRARPGRVRLGDAFLPLRAARAFGAIDFSSFPPGCGSGGPCDWAVYCRANPTQCEMGPDGLPHLVARIAPVTTVTARVVQPLPARGESRTLADQLRTLDGAGTLTRNDPNCITTSFQRVYSWPCQRAADLSPRAVYDGARAALDRLRNVGIPTWRDPEGRRRYYSLVLDYVWIMVWASNFVGGTGVGGAADANYPGRIPLGAPSNWRSPIPPPDYGSGVGAAYWGPDYQTLPIGDSYHIFNTGADPRNLWACDNLANGGTPVMDFGAEIGRRFGTTFATNGYLLTRYAQYLANHFYGISYFAFQASGLRQYAAYLATWPKAWGDPSSLLTAVSRAAADAGTISDVTTGVTTGLSIAAAAVNVVPVFGQIASAVIGIIAGLVAFIHVDTGVHCPNACNYRVLNPAVECPPTPATPPGPLVKAPATAPVTKGTTSPVVVVGAVVAALGLGYFFFKQKS